MNIDELQAGRELDALIAEKVMGWQRRMCPPPDGDGLTWISEPEFPGSQERDWCLDEPEIGELPHYSTSIADAWEVILALRSKFYAIRLENEDDHFPDWRIWIDTPGNRFVGSGETASLAISRAALKAVGV